MPNTLIWIPKRLVELGLVNVAARSPEAFIDYCELGLCRTRRARGCVRAGERRACGDAHRAV